MTAFLNGLEVFSDVEAFYRADERRRYSGEADYGVWWWDGQQGYSNQWRVSVVAATSEVYVVRERSNLGDGKGDVCLLGRISPDPDVGYAAADRVLEGWNLQCGLSDSLRWVVDRVRGTQARDVDVDADAFERGYLLALEEYAWWKDGVQYVGDPRSTERSSTLEAAQRRFRMRRARGEASVADLGKTG